LNKYIKCNFGG